MEVELSRKIFNVNKLYTEKINKILKKYNLTRSDMHFLLRIKKYGETNQEDIIKKTELNSATVTRGLERLEKKDTLKKQ